MKWRGSMVWRTTDAVLLIALLAAGCGESHTPVAGSVRDSAGIRIVEYGNWPATPAPIVVEPQPIFAFGWKASDHPFEDIVAGDILPDGRVAVADGGSTLQVVVLSREGTVEAVLGGPGDGPGEFRRISAVTHLDSSSVVVDDPRSGRLSLFRSGYFTRTVELSDARYMRALGTDSQASVLLGPPLAIVYGRRYPTPWLAVPLIKLDLTAQSFDTVGFADWDRGSGNPFASWGFVAANEMGFVVGRSDTPDLRWLDLNGHLRQIVRWKAARVEVSDSLWSDWEESFRAFAARRPQIYSARDVEESIASTHAQVTEPLPLFGSLMVDPEGEVWIGAYPTRLSSHARTPTRFDVLTPGGEWLGTVSLPPRSRFRLLAVGTDRLMGVARDSLDIQAVVVYRLTR